MYPARTQKIEAIEILLYEHKLPNHLLHKTPFHRSNFPIIIA
jgi:hypothetical protein